MAEAVADAHGEGAHEGDATRRDFIFIATGTFAAVGAAMMVWPLIDQMNPAEDTLAMASTEYDVSQVTEANKSSSCGAGCRCSCVTARRTRSPRRATTIIRRAEGPGYRRFTRCSIGRQSGQTGISDRPGQLHASGLRADVWRRRLWRMAVRLPRLSLRHRRAHPARSGAEKSAARAIRLYVRYGREDRLIISGDART